MTRTVLRWLKDESGATAMEYGLVIALVSLVAITAMSMSGPTLWGRLVELSNQV